MSGNTSALLRFLVVGSGMTALAAALFLALLKAGLHYLPASVLSWIVCVCIGYILNRRLVFRSNDPRIGRQFARFWANGVLQLAVTTVLYALTLDVLRLAPLPATAITSLAGAACSFLVSRFLVFSRRN